MPEPKAKGEEPLQIVAMEIDAGQFTREISLPTDVEPEGVRAEYQDGLLWIYLPYRTQA
jgi:HSP20 family molecular chaperone IbpA